MDVIEEPHSITNVFEKEDNFDTSSFNFFSGITQDIFYKGVNDTNTEVTNAVDKITKKIIKENNNDIILSNYGDSYFND